MDTIEYSSRDKELANKIKAISDEAKPEDCYTCIKCTNGCPANKIFEGFAPHKIQIAAHMGFAEEHRIRHSLVLYELYHMPNKMPNENIPSTNHKCSNKYCS
ncbi:MAG: hypothetical protein ACTSR6_13310 [Candidatus Heimdallarchaeota archaeon]